jgi:hypothetical protein
LVNSNHVMICARHFKNTKSGSDCEMPRQNFRQVQELLTNSHCRQNLFTIHELHYHQYNFNSTQITNTRYEHTRSNQIQAFQDAYNMRTPYSTIL